MTQRLSSSIRPARSAPLGFRSTNSAQLELGRACRLPDRPEPAPAQQAEQQRCVLHRAGNWSHSPPNRARSKPPPGSRRRGPRSGVPPPECNSGVPPAARQRSRQAGQRNCCPPTPGCGALLQLRPTRGPQIRRHLRTNARRLDKENPERHVIGPEHRFTGDHWHSPAQPNSSPPADASSPNHG